MKMIAAKNNSRGMGVKMTQVQGAQLLEVTMGTRVCDPFNAILNHIVRINDRELEEGVLQSGDIEQFVGQWRVLRFQLADYVEKIKAGELTEDAYKNVLAQCGHAYDELKKNWANKKDWVDFVMENPDYGVFSLMTLSKIDEQLK